MNDDSLQFHTYINNRTKRENHPRLKVRKPRLKVDVSPGIKHIKTFLKKMKFLLLTNTKFRVKVW